MLDTVIVWLHRDLRLHDNPALTTALAVGKTVIVAYIWCPKEEGQFQPGRVSRWWLYQSLKRLDAQLQEKGSRICYRKGDSFAEELLKLCKETRCHCVLFNNVYDPISIVRDHTVKEELKAARIYSKSFNAELLHEPWEIVTENGQPYTSFESFWNAVCNEAPYEVPPAKCVEPVCIPAYTAADIYGTTLQDLNLESPEELQCNVHLTYRWSPGTAGALRLFANFLEKGLPLFDKDRAKTDRDSTSKLSPHIHFGEISVRLIYHEVIARQGAIKAANPSSTAVEDFLRQLGYHDYSRYLSFHFPFTHERALLEHVRAVPWVYCSMRFKAWRQGNTGYPIVDAAMRELWATGWMHNRSRVFTASFLVKNLLQPWQWGLKHFWDMLLDADLECDALGWQYVSGCLRDAHPFNYMLDIESESRRFDPTGNYVRKWVPQLSKMPLEWIHMPWLAPKSVLHAAGVTLGEDYPHPIISFDESRAAVDHAWGIIQKCKVPPLRNLEDAPYSAPTCSTSMILLEPEEELDSARGVVRGMPIIRHKTAFEVAVPQHMAGGIPVAGYAPDVVLPDISKLVDHASAAGAAVSGTTSLGSSGPDLLVLARQRVGSSSGSAYAPCDRGRESASEVVPRFAASGVVDDSREERGDEAQSAAAAARRRRHRARRAAPPALQPAPLKQVLSAFTPLSASTRSEVSLQPVAEAPVSGDEAWRGPSKDASQLGQSECTSSGADASDHLASEDAPRGDGLHLKGGVLGSGQFSGSVSAEQDSSSERHSLRDSVKVMD